DKLAALNLTAMDVVMAINQQNLQVAAGQIGQQPAPVSQQFQLTINTLGRLTDPAQFGDIILKTSQQAGGKGGAQAGSSSSPSGQASSGGTGGQRGSTAKAAPANSD